MSQMQQLHHFSNQCHFATLGQLISSKTLTMKFWENMMSMVASFLPTLSLIHAHPAVQGLISYDGRRFPDDQNL